MFWLMGVAIGIAMLAALSVTTALGVPDSPWLQSLNPSTLTMLGIVIALTMMLLSYRSAFFKKSSFASRSGQLFRQMVLIMLAAVLIVISVLQVGLQQQDFSDNRLSQSLRVQAWVSIEGISDSVMTGDSGYRQVAVIEAMAPLTQKLSQSELNRLASDASARPVPIAKPLRVLLQAYPKPETNSDDRAKSASSNSSSRPFKNPSKKKPKAKSSNAALTPSADQLNAIQPGERRLMILTIKPLVDNGSNPASGFDSYRWLRSRHIDGVAQIQAINDTALPDIAANDNKLAAFRRAIDQGRFQLRQHFYQDWETLSFEDQQARAVTLSLITGDRGLIHHDTKDLYQIAGISHLLAISGTHVLFLALILAAAFSQFLNRCWPKGYQKLSRWQWRFLVMVAAAFFYALFTGFDVPAARTAWTLLLVGLLRFSLLPIGTRHVLMALAILMAWMDPLVLWQAGYWLSFIAVALLLAYEEKRSKKESDDKGTDDRFHKTWGHKSASAFKSLFKLQCWLFLALLPITLLLFGKVSLWGLLVNLFAIGLFGWVIVPLNLLAGVVYMISPAAADTIWQGLTKIVGGLHQVISSITTWGGSSQAWLTTAMTPSLLIMSLLVLLPWLLPRGMIRRYVAIPPLLLLMMTVNAQQRSLESAPTLFILPTEDPFISAALLHYPINKSPTATARQVNWLILSDHREVTPSWQNRPSHLSADKLSDSLSDALKRLSISRLDGIIVQSSSQVTEKRDFENQAFKNKATESQASLLPDVVIQLSQNIPTGQYWQSGALSNLPKGQLSAQPCQSGKVWQAAIENSPISIEALTGWPSINDNRVWDCALQVSSQLPIEIVIFNTTGNNTTGKQTAAAPLQWLTQNGVVNNATENVKDENQQPLQQLILDSSRHANGWLLWQLLCANDPNKYLKPQSQLQSQLQSKISTASRVWLGHSRSQIPAEILSSAAIDAVATYDGKPLDAALMITEPP